MKFQEGFSLVELMIAIVIVGLLASIAIPSYTNYMKSGSAQEAPSNLLAMKTQAEQHYADYPSTGYANYPCTTLASAKYFTYACSNLAQNTFTITATGIAGSNIAGWTYSIDQTGNRASSGVDGASSTTCWITKSGGSC